MTFTGFPPTAAQLYARLATDNTKEGFKALKNVYERDVLAPMTALARELSQEFGDVQVLRPQRDTRMSHDKSPYKTYQGAYVDTGPCLGYWVHLDADGLYASGRYYPFAAQQIARYRTIADDEHSGSQLAAMLSELSAAGFTIGGDRLRTRPRGTPADHPRLELLKHRKLDVGRRLPADGPLDTRQALEMVRDTWQAVRPLLRWAAERRINALEEVPR
ncbi:DUF2461 domain-containing protein [Streptomyces sp. NPDC093097]|uniref:DUF2461 domain-containing protein n=1 Tax=Streptomyces sp. NPDC093097 TaxID=3366027 RepID=UPI003830257F